MGTAKQPTALNHHSITIPLHQLGVPMEARVAPPVTRHFEVETYPTNAVIYRPIDRADRLFRVRKGRVRILRASKGSSGRTLVSLLRAGDVFGDVMASAGGQMGEFAVAGSDAEIWSVRSENLHAFCASDPDSTVDLFSAITDRLRLSRQRVVGFTAKEVPARLAETLLMLGASHGERCSHGGELDLRQVTQQDLADLVGASRSFVSTLINEMKRAGSLGSVGRVLCLHDLKALRKAAGEEA